MEKIHKNIRVFMLSCIKHACFHVFSPFSAYFSPHDIIAEKGPLYYCSDRTFGLATGCMALFIENRHLFVAPLSGGLTVDF